MYEISPFDSYLRNGLCLQMSRLLLDMTVTNGAVTRLQNGKDLGNITTTDSSKETRTLARTIQLAQGDTIAFGTNPLCAGEATAFQVQLLTKGEVFAYLSMSALPPCVRQTLVLLHF